MGSCDGLFLGRICGRGMAAMKIMRRTTSNI